MSRRSIIIAGSIVLSGAVLVLFAIHARNEAELTKTISYTHYIAVHLRGYQEETGHLPVTLEAMVSEGFMDSGLLHLFFHGTEVDYQSPPDSADDSFRILQVHYKGNTVVVTKSFDRTVIRQQDGREERRTAAEF